MAIALADNIQTGAPKPTDSRYFNNQVAWTGVTEVNTNIGSGVRYSGLTVNINGEEYWYKEGIEDVDLVLKTTGGGSATSGENVTKEVTQSSHGFAINDFIGWSGGTYNKAIADGNYDGEFVGIVTASADTNTFSVTQSGYVSGLTASFAANTTYWLSEGTAGLLTATEPTGDGEISKSAFIANTTSSGWVLPYAGVVVSTGATSISTANNGLTDNGGIVQLGGTLCQHTDIDVSGYNLSISGLSGKTTQQKAVFVDDATGTLVTGLTTSGCGDYSLTSPATCTVGGVSPGYVMTGKTLECIIQDAFAPYVEPTFSSFLMTQTSPMEVGDALSGSKNFSWVTTSDANVTAGSVGICEVGGALLGSGFNYDDSPQSLAIGTLTNTSPTTYTWQVTGCSTQDNPFTRNVSKCSVYPYYWGVVADGARPAVDNDLVTGGTKIHTSNSCSTVTVDFDSVSEYTWLALPTNNPSTVPIRNCWYQTAFSNGGMGSGGDKYPDVCTLDITSGDGCWSTVSYKVYMSAIAWSDADPIQFCS